MMTNTIAVVDDDRNILNVVAMALKSEGFAVRGYADGTEALEALTKQPADLAILDIKMPGMAGTELLRQLRKASTMPVIFLTSRQDEVDEVIGLRMGADDYIRKPCSPCLLIERIRVLLRRANPAHGTDAVEPAIHRGHLFLDPARHQTTWNDINVDLTVTEFLVLKTLALRPGHVKSRQQLIDAAYGDSTYGSRRMIDNHVKRLRNKFKAVDANFKQIETLYGIGYRFRHETAGARIAVAAS